MISASSPEARSASISPRSLSASASFSAPTMKRIGSSQEMAAAVLFLLSEAAGWMTGQIIHVDGGITAQLSPPGGRALEKDIPNGRTEGRQ